MSNVLACDNCGRELPSETSECTFCARDLPAVSPKHSYQKHTKSSHFPYAGVGFVLVLAAWAVMLIGSGRVSLEHTNTLERVRLFAPYSMAQVIFHKIGFYLSLASLPLTVLALVKDRKSQLAWVTLATALLYVIPRLIVRG